MANVLDKQHHVFADTFFCTAPTYSSPLTRTGTYIDHCMCERNFVKAGRILRLETWRSAAYEVRAFKKSNDHNPIYVLADFSSPYHADTDEHSQI